MGNITGNLKKILTAVYGKDVRQAIHDSIKQCWVDVSGAVTNANSALNKADKALDTATDAVNIMNKAVDTINAADEVAGMVLGVVTEPVYTVIEDNQIWYEGKMVNSDTSGAYWKAARAITVSSGEIYLITTHVFYNPPQIIPVMLAHKKSAPDTSGAEFVVSDERIMPLVEGGNKYLVEIPDDAFAATHLLITSESSNQDDTIEVRKLRI